MAWDAQVLRLEHGRDRGHELFGFLQTAITRPGVDGEAVLHAVLGLGIEGAGRILADDQVGKLAVLGYYIYIEIMY